MELRARSAVHLENRLTGKRGIFVGSTFFHGLLTAVDSAAGFTRIAGHVVGDSGGVHIHICLYGHNIKTITKM